MTTTILIKRDVDRNYIRLFAVVVLAAGWQWVVRLTERETPAGREVQFRFLPPEVVTWVAGRPLDFAVIG